MAELSEPPHEEEIDQKTGSDLGDMPGDELAELRRRVTDLEREVQENRGLNRRLAELVDVVAELLMPATHLDEQKLNEVLSKLADSR